MIGVDREPRGHGDRRGVLRAVQDSLGTGRARAALPGRPQHGRAHRRPRRGPVPGLRLGRRRLPIATGGIPVEHVDGPVDVAWGATSFPIYGGFAPFGGGALRAVAGIEWTRRRLSRRIRRRASSGGLATTCFEEVRHLLTRRTAGIQRADADAGAAHRAAAAAAARVGRFVRRDPAAARTGTTSSAA